MINEQDQNSKHPLLWESALVFLVALFISNLIAIMVVGVFEPEVFENRELLQTSKWFFALSQIVSIILVIYYFYKKKYPLKKIFRIKKINNKTLIWTLVLSFALIPLLDELDRLVKLLIGFEDTSNAMLNVLKSNNWAEYLLLIFIVTIIAPVFEECFFRGAIQQSLEKRAGIVNGILITSLIFASLHPFLSWILQIFVLSVFLGLFSFYFKSIIPSLIIHAVNNLFALIILNLKTNTFIEYYEYKNHVHYFWIVLGLLLTYVGVKKIFAQPQVSN